MGRPRGFNEDDVLEAAAAIFVRSGYEGTSIDDLVKGLNLHRGSIYKAFGSKRGLFLAVLQRHINECLQGDSGAVAMRGGPSGAGATRTDLDLLLVAAVERGHCDAEVAALVRHGLELVEKALPGSGPPPRSDTEQPPGRALHLLSARLYARLLADPDPARTPPELTKQET